MTNLATLPPRVPHPVWRLAAIRVGDGGCPSLPLRAPKAPRTAGGRHITSDTQVRRYGTSGTEPGRYRRRAAPALHEDRTPGSYMRQHDFRS